jgi:putative oxidoreductase
MKKLFFSTKNLGNDFALLLIRLTFGSLIIVNHGLAKIEKLTNPPVKFIEFLGMSPEISLGLTVFAEVICGALLILGLATRFAALTLVINFFVIVFVVKAASPIGDLELPVMFFIAYCVLVITGPGKFSVDYLINKG